MTVITDHTPFPDNATWRITFSLGANGVSPHSQFTVPAFGPQQQLLPFTDFDGMVQTVIGGNFIDQGTQPHVTVHLEDGNGTVIDQGAQQIAWDPTSGLGQQGATNVASPSSVLTPVEQQQLGNADAAATQSQQLLPNFLQVAVPGVNDFLVSVRDAVIMNLGDQITQIPIGLSTFFRPSSYNTLGRAIIANGCTDTPIDADLSHSPIHAVALTLTTIPADWKFGTPSADWSYHDAAVLEVEIDDLVVARHGIHVPYYELSPLPNILIPWIGPLPVGITPNNYHVHVYFAEGFCGELVQLTVQG